MNKSLMYALVAAGAVVVVGAAVFFNNKAAAPGGGEASEASLRELMARGGSQRCTFDYDIEGARSNGTVYIASGKMRGDFSSMAGGQTVASHMIVDGETAYMWSDAMSQGVMMSFATAGGQNENTGAISPDQRVGYSCGSWSPDQGMFMLPSGVDFIDFAAAMGAAAGGR